MYYVEIGDCWTNEYIIQSKFFTTIDEAKEWANDLDFVENNLYINILKAIFDEDGEYVGDEEIVEELR